MLGACVHVIQVRDKSFARFEDFLEDLQAKEYLTAEQRANLQEHMCAYDELGVNPDGITRGKKLSTKKLQKKNFRNAQRVQGMCAGVYVMCLMHV